MRIVAGLFFLSTPYSGADDDFPPRLAFRPRQHAAPCRCRHFPADQPTHDRLSGATARTHARSRRPAARRLLAPLRRHTGGLAAAPSRNQRAAFFTAKPPLARIAGRFGADGGRGGNFRPSERS